MIHAIANGMPDETLSDPEDTWQLLHLFANHLPCTTCGSHFRTFLTRRGMPQTRSSLVALLNDAHNEVNIRLGKRTYTLREHICMFSPSASDGLHVFPKWWIFFLLLWITVITIKRLS